LKKNQQLKYLNKGSAHTEACFTAIPLGVMKRLASLTTRTAESEILRMDELYPKHAEALRAAKLVHDVFLTLGEILDETMSSTIDGESESPKKKRDTQCIPFIVGMCKFWEVPIHVRLKELRNKYGLTWLRFTMCYTKFSNLREMFQGDLGRKLMKGIMSRDFMDLPCNCNAASKIDGKCIYKGDCRKMCVVYQAKCKICDEVYIGNTQQKMKERQGQHLHDVRELSFKEKKSDSFAAHFASHFPKGSKPSNYEIRQMLEYKILWQANPISCLKTFGTLECSLCMRERIEILRVINQKAGGEGEWKIINTNNEIFGACRHKTRFHRFLKETSNVKSTRTDEGSVPERGSIGRIERDKGAGISLVRPERSRDVTPPPGDLSICSPTVVCV